MCALVRTVILRASPYVCMADQVRCPRYVREVHAVEWLTGFVVVKFTRVVHYTKWISSS